MRYCLLLLLFLLSACARPYQPPMPLPSEEELLQKLSQGLDTYLTLDGEAKVGVTVAGKYFSSQQFILLERPDRFRTDVLSSFGQLILQLAVDRDDLKVFLNTTVPGKFYQGTASDENLTRFTRLPVHFKDMVRLLLYDPPLIASRSRTVGLHERGVALEIAGENSRQELIFDRELRLVESRYFTKEILRLHVMYDKFNQLDAFPQRIRIEIPEQKTSASVRFSQVMVNTPIPAGRFTLEVPANALLEKLPD